MRPTVPCFLLCLLLLQFIVAIHTQHNNFVVAETEERATSEKIPENNGVDFTSEYLYHTSIEPNTGIDYYCFTPPTFDFTMLTSGVTFVELRPPDRLAA